MTKSQSRVLNCQQIYCQLDVLGEMGFVILCVNEKL
nr:MAG TPA: hypothetical protein [Caudoviricetes sp.]